MAHKLSSDEEHALSVLRKHGSYCPGDITLQTVPDLKAILEGLRKKKYVTVEMTDDGPRYHAA